MLTLYTGKYKLRDLQLLHQLIADSMLYSLDCMGETCEECEASRVCHDLQRLDKFVIEKINKGSG